VLNWNSTYRTTAHNTLTENTLRQISELIVKIDIICFNLKSLLFTDKENYICLQLPFNLYETMRPYIYLLISLFSSVQLLCQPKSHIDHYNLEEGLPQRSIMDIMQDRKGFIWLATWDGLCKFDGYNFTSYKTTVNDSVIMGNNRIHNIEEDIYGYIWLSSYSYEVFRFDPRTEKYIATYSVGDAPFRTSGILPMPSGRVWLKSETMGAICVPDTLNTYKIFSPNEKNLPSYKVNTVFEDSSHISWILTDNGLVKVSSANTDEFEIFFNRKEESRKEKHFFSAIETDSEIWFGASDGEIWCYNKNDKTFNLFESGAKSDIVSIKKIYDKLFIILTSKDGFLVCDTNKNNLKRFDKSNLKGLPTNEMLSCFIDSNNNIWLETNSKGVAKFNLIDNKLEYYQPNDYGNNTILFPSFFIIEDKTGHIWVHPHGGFSFYDEKSDKLVPFYNNPFSHEWRFSDILHNAFLDKQGNLWLSTRSGGLEKVVFDNTLFKLNDFYSNKISITGFEVRAILEDNNNNIWLGNKEGIVSIYDAKRDFKGFLCHNGIISKSGSPLKAMAYTLLQDTKGNIWIGTKGDGISLLKPKDKTQTSYYIEQYRHDSDNPFSLSDDIVYSIHEDERGRIWIGSYGGGINLFDQQHNRFINKNNNFRNYPNNTGAQIRTVQSRDGKVYIGSTLGLIVLSINDKDNTISDYKTYSKTYKDENGIRANDIHNILVTRNKEIYVATFGGGMSKVTSWDKDGFPATFKTYDTHNGLHSDIVLSITEDNRNFLWINSEGNLSRFDPKDESFQQFNDASRTISKQYFMETLPLLTNDGELIYGCAHGTLSFFPDKITQNTYSPYLALTKFKVSNNDYPLKIKIDDINSITLTHKENIFSLEFTALDYTNPHGISYAYMLEGFDKEWINNQGQRVANYTNIPPGEYVFKVRSTNSNGTWVDNERSLSIVITPSFWQTKWAYFVYIISFIIILYIILRSIFIFYRMRDKVLLEQEQTEMKTRFFTDISHEIRTPLTMIVSPIENILDNQKTHPEIKPQLQMVLRNSNRMLNMVNQILDFRKIQKLKLQVKETPIGEYIENLCDTSFKIAESQNTHIEFNNSVGDVKIWVDPDSIDKLISNLISNSVKHTNKGGKIEVNLFWKDKAVAIQVKDEGEGMSKEVINKLFTRFASYNKDKSKPSTGIGLSIVKEIADKHHAKIIVDSNVNEGSSFTFLFQTGLEHFSKDQNAEIINTEVIINKEIENPDKDYQEEIISEENGSNNKSRLSILVVEDDHELRNFIKSVLTDYYEVYEAQNGREGYDNTVKYMPDFILSDIMMPDVDGIEFLQRVRTNPDTSHIPFILLTAKTNIDDQLEGITSGANDYITKPFSVKLLIAKIDNIIKQRKLYAGYIGNVHSEEPEEQAEELVQQNKITEQDESFLRKLKEDIYSNLDNSDFNIDTLVSNTNLSRRVFFNKVKSLTGQAPVEFIREIRIKHAAELLKTQQYRIKEVTYMVGFSDIRYFTQCFKNMFGVTPSQYKDQSK